MDEYRRIIDTKDEPSKDWEKRRDIIHPLVELGTDEAINLVCDLLIKDPNSSVRIRAASVLKEVNNPSILACLLKALKDWDSGVRLRVLKTLGDLNLSFGEEIIPVLLEMEKKDNSEIIKLEIKKILKKQSDMKNKK
ncbi:MAG: hypothetical protein HeimC3_38180 [Candidatus Heimdallarchaeota archaeon LC_3]|nr:MAG: hypothetical protein HeimC3_38180 [Candidatus Heimdallarchaeota archaeon LC_3]